MGMGTHGHGLLAILPIIRRQCKTRNWSVHIMMYSQGLGRS